MSFTKSRAVALCSLASLTLSAALADQVVLKNGDRVTGAGKSLTTKTGQFGVVTTSWDQVASVVAGQPLSVVLPDGRTIQGTIATTNGKLEVATKDATVSVEPAEVAAIRNDVEQKAYRRLQNPGWGQLWAGAGSIGFAGASGNARTLTFNTGLNAARVTSNDKMSLYFNTIQASALVGARNADTAQALRAGVGYDHNLKPRWFANVFNDWEYDLTNPGSYTTALGITFAK